MPYKTISDAPDWVKKMPKGAQKIWIAAFNSAFDRYGDEERAFKIAISAVKKIYRKNKDGKWVRKKTMSYSFPICLSEAKIKERMDIHVIPVGEWKHELYGDMKVTEEDIEEFVQHFDNNIRKGVYITAGHQLGDSPAIGWFEKLKAKNKSGLWGIVRWTKKGRELLEERAYKYFSPEFFGVYEDPETHRVYNNVLTGGALTNSPFFKELKSIVMTDETILDQFSEENIMSREQEQEKEFSEDEEEVDENEESNDKESETEELSEDESGEESEKDENEEKDEDKNDKSGDEETELADKGVKKFAKWTRAFINDLPDSSFAYIEKGGKKDKDRKTVPRSLRHLPYKDASGKVDLPHLRNAIARAPRVKDKNGNKLPEGTVKRLQTKLQKILAKIKKKTSDKVTYREPEAELSEKIVYQVMNSANIELSEKQDLSEFRKELLRTGTWQHKASKGGVLEVTEDMLNTIVKNFKDKVLDNVFVPLGHPASDDPSKNVGEVVDLEVEPGEKAGVEKLMATLDVKVKDTIKKIKDKLIKGISASIAENYMKKDTGEYVGPTLFHAALVGEPYIKGMSPFVPLSEDMKDSIVIPIMNMIEPLTLEELGSRVQTLEDKIKNMSEDTTTKESETSEETPEKEKSSEEETAKEETSTEEAPKEDTPEEKTSEGETKLGCSPCGDKAEETPAEAPAETPAEETPVESPAETPAEEASAETTEKETVEEKSKEETSEEDTSKKELSEEATEETKESSEEESSKEETSETEETKSPDVGEKAEEGEKEETETEETKTEETESKAEEAKEEGVDLAEAETMFVELLHSGKVTPAEKVFVLPLLASKTPIELSEGEKVASGKAMFEYLKKQSPKFSLSEEGTSEKPDKEEKKEEEIPEDINKVLSEMGISKDLKQEVYKEYKKEKEGEKSTPF